MNIEGQQSDSNSQPATSEIAGGTPQEAPQFTSQTTVESANVRQLGIKPASRTLITAIAVLGVLLIVASAAIIWLVLTKNSSSVTTTEQSSVETSQNSATDAATRASIAMRARDSERLNDIKILQIQLETYYAMNGAYPALQDVNNNTWRTGNEFNVGTDDTALADPVTPSVKKLLGSVPSTATGNYVYNALPSGCTSITDSAGSAVEAPNYCTGYKLIALVENKDASYKDPSSTSSQTFYIKKNVD